ncbi:MAG: hypothetical protein GKC53_03855 [Neisseriaceae bacterium]|nr:MAG: hypothetical protein GKC53_03855 [Neisseriaceae bacterium]
MIARKLKKLSQSIILAVPLIISHTVYAADEYFDHKFASTPLEYASLMSPGIKPNLIFLVDNSTFTDSTETQAIITGIVTDPDMISTMRVGLAYLYADSHPFISFELPTQFLICASTQLVAIGPPAISLIVAAIGSSSIITGGLAIIAGLPGLFTSLLALIGPIITTCIPTLRDTSLNIEINSQKLTQEVKLNDLSINLPEVINSLTLSMGNSIIPIGLPTITRRYYEITREIRGLEPNNSFMYRPINQIPSGMNNIKNIISLFENVFNHPIVSNLPGVGIIVSTIKTFLNDIVRIAGSTQEYQPLFTDAMQYRCQPNFVIVLSSGIVTPGSLGINDVSGWLSTFLNLIALPAQALGIDTKRYFPIPDLNELQIPEDDTLVRRHIYSKNGTTLNFLQWNNPVTQYKNHGLAFLSTLFDQTDLKTEKDGTDAEGKSWDDEDFPFQNITTITIDNAPIDNSNDVPLGNSSKILTTILSVFINGLNDVVANPAYLKNAASYSVKIGKNSYFSGISSIDEVKKVVKESIMGVSQKNISSAASTVLSQMNPTLGVSAYLNTKNWSSSLRLYTLNEHNNDFTVNLNNYLTPNYGSTSHDNIGIGNTGSIGIQPSRRILVSTGKTEPEFLKGDTAFNQWLIRPHNLSDKQINEQFHTNLRDRCQNKEINCPDRMLGDILNSPILAIDENPTSRNRSSDPYTTFIVTAANDGMVHIFKRTGNDNSPYNLVLDYLPAAAKRAKNTTIWEQLPSIAHPGYGKHQQYPHQFFNNGGIAYMGTMKKNCDQGKAFTCQNTPAQLFMVGSYGQGGRGLYALNIGGVSYTSGNQIALSNTNQAYWPKEVPLWESGSDKYGANQNDNKSKQAHLSLGYIMGTPVLANVSINRKINNELNQMKPQNNGETRYAVITNDGFFSDNEEPTLYIFDALGITKIEGVDSDGTKRASSKDIQSNRGKLIAKIKTGNKSKSSNRQSLSPPSVLDLDGDNIADIAYAGDYEGNLYRFDLRKSSPNDWTASMIYKAHNSKQPITTAPTLYKLDGTGSKYVVIFGTGSDLFEDDLLKNKSQIQTIYGIYDDLNDTSIKATNRHNLLNQTMTKSRGNFKGEPKTIITLSDNKMTSKYRGWYIDLTNDIGERITRSGKLTGNSVFFTTRSYRSENSGYINYSNSCVNPIASSNGYLLGINPRTGGRLKRNMMNLNPIEDRYKENVNFISGFKFHGVPSELSFVTLGQDVLTNTSGQFNSGWEDSGITHIRQHSNGSLAVTSTSGEYYVISVSEPNYIRIRKLNSRELF